MRVTESFVEIKFSLPFIYWSTYDYFLQCAVKGKLFTVFSEIKNIGFEDTINKLNILSTVIAFMNQRVAN